MSEGYMARRVEEEIMMRAYASGEPVNLGDVPAGARVAFDPRRRTLIMWGANLQPAPGWTWHEETDPGPPRPAPTIDLAKLRAAAKARRAGGDAPALGGERAEGT